MIETRLLMGMPITIEIVNPPKGEAGKWATKEEINKIFTYFEYIDRTFSTFKPDSEISKINRGEILEKDFSEDMKVVFKLAEKTKSETDGYFDILDNNGKYNPSGIVKGWAIYYATQILLKDGFENFYVNAGGDIQFYGKRPASGYPDGKIWSSGIKNPFNQNEIVKVVYLKSGQGIATSGNYIRGDHIYNPKDRKRTVDEIVSFTVIGPNVLEADRFATAVFAMGKNGINFLEKMPGLAGYMIDKNGTAFMTSNFDEYTTENS